MRRQGIVSDIMNEIELKIALKITSITIYHNHYHKKEFRVDK